MGMRAALVCSILEESCCPKLQAGTLRGTATPYSRSVQAFQFCGSDLPGTNKVADIALYSVYEG
jgi:hypothetical protein